jgi:hypothetical protein
MYLSIFLGFLMLAIASCQNQQSKIPGEIIESNISSATISETEKKNATTEELVGFFSDDSNIGLPHRNKIEVSNFKKLNGNMSDGNIAVIKFYSRDASKNWKLKQTYEFEKDSLTDCDAKLEDFNNDGLKDLTYISNVAARGANELRRLFIYNKKKDELTYIKNSEEYPNIQYNKELDCIDAWLFYGGTSTVFLKIDGDTLKGFASVETYNETRTVDSIDKNGKRKLLRTDKVKVEDGFVRYKNFNPPEPYEKEESN